MYLEESRLYVAYVRTLSGDALVMNQRLSPAAVEAARDVWLAARARLHEIVGGPDEIRATIRARVHEDAVEVKRAT